MFAFRTIGSACLLGLLSAITAWSAEIVPDERKAAWLQAARELTKQAELQADVSERYVDVAVCAKAVEWITRHEEFHKPDYVKWTDQVLSAGQERLAGFDGGHGFWLDRAGMTTVFGYQSDLDGSYQPFAVTLPQGFDRAANKRWPLQLVLHGRGDTLNEVSFFHQHDGKPLQQEIQWIQLDVFGRTNNAYRWAGEVDVFEALHATVGMFPIDEQRITLWGFSMGGAGAWHLGLHHPDRWSSVGAGAGFSDTVNYLNLKEPLSPLHQKLIRIYDAVDYTLNAADVPIIGYGGELDKQLLAAKTMHEKAEELGVEIPLLIGPQTEHKFHPDSLKEFMAFHAAATEQGRSRFPGPNSIRFTTCTPKYNSCYWLSIEEQLIAYEPSVVEAQVDVEARQLTVSTKNIGVLAISRDVAETVVIDGSQPLPLLSAAGGLLPDVYFLNTQDGWSAFDYRESHQYQTEPGLNKRHQRQGPIDDAFTRSFLCVRGTGKPWSQEHDDWARWTLERFAAEYDKFFRAKLPTINDTQVTEELLESHNLILFGDPGSNAVIARVIDRLPIGWDQAGLEVRGEKLAATEHGVPLIYPNPLNPHRYVVLNSGHTFHAAEFRGSNAQLYPRLGDVAIIKFARQSDGSFQETVQSSELFNVRWSWVKE